MAITTSLKRSYVLQRVVLATLCVVLGAWGVADYFVWIPEKQQAYARAEVYRAVNDAITAHSTGAENAEESMTAARTALHDAAARVTDVARASVEGADAETLTTEQRAEKMRSALEGANLQQWLFEIAVLQGALGEAARTPAGQEAQRSPEFLQTIEMLKLRLSETDDISEVSSVDRITKGVLFMPCLPYGIWLFISLGRMRKVRYVLEDDRTLRTPGGDIAPEQIDDVDMSRWMAKSFAVIRLKDGREIKIDDFYHQNAHLIIGELAHERDPAAWNADATPVKPEEERDVEDEDSESTPEPAADPASEDDSTVREST